MSTGTKNSDGNYPHSLCRKTCNSRPASLHLQLRGHENGALGVAVDVEEGYVAVAADAADVDLERARARQRVAFLRDCPGAAGARSCGRECGPRGSG